jgi:hypothetical protein
VSNNTGVIYGVVTSASDGSPLSGVDVSLNWVQRAEGNPLQVGGNDDLTTWVPTCTTTKNGAYVIPFFWASEQVPGDVASALAMRWFDDNSHTSQNKHGQLFVGVDVRRLFGLVAPPIPSSGGSAGSMFLKFFLAFKDDLKGMGILTRFIGSLKLSAIELQGCYSRIDFSL